VHDNKSQRSKQKQKEYTGRTALERTGQREGCQERNRSKLIETLSFKILEDKGGWVGSEKYDTRRDSKRERKETE
jgi:regulatory protein YycH of two-component signal transduction system YycFG